jgi:polyisoprenoid-binding protein YceI
MTGRLRMPIRGSLMRRLFRVLIALVALVVVLGFAAWYFVLRTDPAARAEIKETPTVAAPETALDGTYAVTPGNVNNFVGYRVTEQFIGAIVENTATGRTDDVTGTLTIRGTTVSDIKVVADLRSLASDNKSRDGQIRDLGLESNRYPKARFVATRPITLAAVPAPGKTVTTRATGTFTLHGVTRPIVIMLVGRWDGTTVQVVGSLPIVLGDYHIAAPTVGPVASIDDHAEMEFQLFFEKPTSTGLR